MDKIISKLSVLGVLCLIIIINIESTGVSRSAAYNYSISIIDDFWNNRYNISLLSERLTEYGFDAVFTGVVKELYKNGETKDSILGN